MIVQKGDLVNNYDYKQVKEAERKERTKWMYIVLVGCWLFQMLPYCIALNLGGVLSSSDWAAWVNNDSILLNLTFTMGAVGAALFAPGIAAAFNKKINLRFMYSLGIILTMSGFAMLAINSALVNANGHSTKDINIAATTAILWIPTIIMQIGVMIFSGLGVNYLISSWWPPEKRGTALGFAFTGGSMGNIWMQQLLALAAKKFGNTTLTKTGDNSNGYVPKEGYYELTGNDQQWLTYVIFGVMGLVLGIAVAMIICRKPIPQVEILNAKSQDEKQEKQEVAASNKITDVNFLQTKGYIPYWVLAIGLTMILMATAHANIYAQVFRQGAAVANGIGDVSSILGNEGTTFAICCLVGNFCGGILNDKMGPVKSISLGGIGQVGALICLLFSIVEPDLIYGYAVFAGLSVYLYTSTPAFLCGKLYGPKQSTTHMSIYSLFLALGFAIINSLTGPIMGKTDNSNVHKFMGKETYGNMAGVLYLLLALMIVGVIITVSMCYVIGKKGIKGIAEYSPTKYSKIIYLKHSKAINFAAMRIELAKKDFRTSEKRTAKMKNKKANSKYQNIHDKYLDAVKTEFASAKLTEGQRNILGNVFFYEIANIETLKELSKSTKEFEKDLKFLLDKKYIAEMTLSQTKSYKLTESSVEKLASFVSSLNSTLGNINKENASLESKISAIDAKTATKLEKLNAKLEKAKADKEIILANKEDLETQKQVSTQQVQSLTQKRDAALAKAANKSEWVKYQIDYAYADKINTAKAAAEKAQKDADAKIIGIQKKMGVAQYMNGYNKNVQIRGHKLLLDYYNDIYGTYDKLIDAKINDDFERKLSNIQSVIAKKQAKEAKIVANESKIKASMVK